MGPRLTETVRLIGRLNARLSMNIGGVLEVRGPSGESQSYVIGGDGGRRLSPHSRFRWFCASKPILSLALGALIDEGTLSWESAVGDVLDAPPEVAACSIEDLLDHRIRFAGDPPFSAVVPGSWADLKLEALGSRIADRDADKWYSIWTNWIVLGAVVESVSTEELDSALDRLVLKPLGLRFTSLAGPFREEDGVNQWEVNGTRVSLATLKNARQQLATMEPATGAVGPVADLAELYRHVVAAVRGSEESPIPASITSKLASARDRDFCAGFLLDATRLWREAPARLVGAPADESVLSFGDLDNGVAVAAAFNYSDPSTAGWRNAALAKAVYTDLGLL